MLTPNDKFNFGKYRGQLLSDVYKYFPNYIEWAILNVSSFCIDVEDFERLPLPTPLDSRSQLEIVDRAKYELYLEKLKKDLEEKDLCTGGILEAKIQLMGYGKNTKTANTGLLFVVDLGCTIGRKKFVDFLDFNLSVLFRNFSIQIHYSSTHCWFFCK
jgi:hypothetical protein